MSGLHAARLLGAAPEGIKLLLPSALGRWQALQGSPHADVQQTPSTQKTERHLPSQGQRSRLLGGPPFAEQGPTPQEER